MSVSTPSICGIVTVQLSLVSLAECMLVSELLLQDTHCLKNAANIASCQ